MTRTATATVALSTIAGTVVAGGLWWMANTYLETTREHQARIVKLESEIDHIDRLERRLDDHLDATPGPHTHEHAGGSSADTTEQPEPIGDPAL